MRTSRTWRAPATAVPALMLALMLALTLAPTRASTPASADSSGYGHTGAADRRLRPGCHRYRYHYVLTPPTGDWMFETYLFDPRGKPRGTNDFAPGSDPAQGYGHFGICRSVVVPGRFTIRAQLTWFVPPSSPLGQPTEHTVWLDPSHFRLRRS